MFSPKDRGADDNLDSDADSYGQTAVFTLAMDQHRTDLDAGLVLSGGSIGDFVWYDADADGIQDEDEAGIPGVEVNLYTNAGELVATTQTDDDGYYLFHTIAPGDYYLEFIRPFGYLFSPVNAATEDLDSDPDADGITPTFTLVLGENDFDWDAGLRQGAAVGDYVWLDENLDGLQNSGEPGVANVPVKLLDGNGNLLRETTTDGDGYYIFEALVAGDYQVEFAEAGAMFTIPNAGADTIDSDADPLTGRSPVFSLDDGEWNMTIDAGVIDGLSSVSDFVWDDIDADGLQDPGEPGVAGITVRLLDEDQNVILETQTNLDGYYQFDNLWEGTYYVKFSSPGAIEFTLKDAGTDETIDSDADPATGRTDAFFLPADTTNTTIDAGLVSGIGSIGDYVWYDDDADGIQDVSELGLADVEVQLYTASGNYVDSVWSGASGDYLFQNVAAGDYYLKFVRPFGYIFSPANATTDDLDSDPDANGITPTFSLADGEDITHIDAGLREGAAVGDFVWYDTNGDGLQGAGEPGAAGIVVRLLDDEGYILLETTTDSSGFYIFEGLAPGTYQVEFGDGGETFTIPNAGDDALDSDADPATGRSHQFTLADGEWNMTIDAGLTTSEISDFVWHDENENGLQNAGEAGVPGITVRLLDEDLNVLQETVTDLAGLYSFTDVAEGTYIVEFTYPQDPDAILFTAKDVGSNDAIDSDADPTTGRTDPFFLPAGTINNTIDAGLLSPLPPLPIEKNSMNISPFGGDPTSPGAPSAPNSGFEWWLTGDAMNLSAYLPVTSQSRRGYDLRQWLADLDMELLAGRGRFSDSQTIFVG